jgi:hypothetical protein
MARVVKRAGSRKALNADNLVALGAERLAAILMDAGEDDPNLKRRLRMELAVEAGADHLAAEIGKRLGAIEGRRSRVHWRKYKAFVRDLDLQRAMIVGPLARLDARLALGMLWRFLALAEDVFEQVDDARGQVEAVFRAAVAETGALVAAAKPGGEALAEQIAAMLEAPLGMEDLVGVILPVLDPKDAAILRAKLLTAFEATARPSPVLRAAVQSLADAAGDVDGYLATFSASELKQPWAGALIAERLTKAGRVEEALAALARSAPPTGARTLLAGAHDWEDAYLDALEADGQGALAQELRWAAFETRLATDRLRAFLKRLADFDDVEAEDKAMALAKGFANFTVALRFFTEWPAAANAAALVLDRTGEIEAGKAEVLEPAARLLEPRHPLAASLLLRAMITDTLRWARADRLKDAQRHLAELASLSVQVADWGEFEPHDAFLARMAQIRRL